jgi:hypothetical protein
MDAPGSDRRDRSDHGRSIAPGVHSGVNAFGCCAGPMQFNLRDGPPSTWQSYRVDGDADGDTSPYDAADAIASAARYLGVLLDGARGDIERAVFGYNHSRAYAADVLARARAYSAQRETTLTAPVPEPGTAGTSCAAEVGAGDRPVNLQTATRRDSPRAYAPLPARAMAGGRPAELIDARLLDDALWLLRTYRLRVTAARGRPQHPRRRHRPGPRPRRPGRPGRLGPIRRRTRARPRLDTGVRSLRQPPGLPAGAGDPVRRLRRLPRPWVAAHLHGPVRRASASVVGLALLRNERSVSAMRVGHGVRDQAKPSAAMTPRRPPHMGVNDRRDHNPAVGLPASMGTTFDGPACAPSDRQRGAGELAAEPRGAFVAPLV